MTTLRIDSLPVLLLFLAGLVLFAIPGVVRADEIDDYLQIQMLIQSGKQQETSAAINLFTQKYPSSEKTADLHFLLAQMEPRLYSRLSLLRKIEAKTGSSARAADALFEVVELSYLTGNTRDTIGKARQFRSLYPSDPRCDQVAGMQVRALMAGRQFLAAQHLLEETGLKSSTETWVRTALAQIYMADKRPLRARKYLEAAIQEGTGDVSGARCMLGDLRLAEGDEPGAVFWFEEVVRLYPFSFESDRARRMLHTLTGKSGN